MSDRKSGSSNIPNTAIAVGVAAAAAVGGLLYYWFNKEEQQENNYAHGVGPSRNLSNESAFAPPRRQIAAAPSVSCPTNTNASGGRENIEECAVCFENLFTEDESYSAPVEIPCNHYFHMACIRKWFKEIRSCPVCNARIPDDLKTVYF